MNIENLITKGKYFVPVNQDKLGALKDTLQNYLAKKNYSPAEGVRSFFFQDNFLASNFQLDFNRPRINGFTSLKKNLSLIGDDEIYTQHYFSELAKKRKEIPFHIKILLSIQKIGEREGIVVEIMTKPVAYFLITQLNKKLHFDKNEFSLIKIENSDFIKELMGAIGAVCLEEPVLLSSAYQPASISMKLTSFGFSKVSKLLDAGRNKIEVGEPAIGELLGVIELFLHGLVERLGEKPFALHQPEKNITKLKSLGYLSNQTEGTIQSSIYHAIYRKLKDADHKKEDLNYFDLSLYFGITESVIDFLIDVTLKYKIKVNLQPVKVPNE